MKPQIVMHMAISIDGRIVPTSWPETVTSELTDVYESIHRDLRGDAWIVGRVTMAEFGKGAPRPAAANGVYSRTTWKAEGAETGPYAVAIDQGGKLHLNLNRANGDPIVVILVESVSDDHLAQLRRDGISYLFAGDVELDLSLAVERLATEFGVQRLLLEGGGGINGSFLERGLIDEVSLLVAPVADGSEGPTIFSAAASTGTALDLKAVDRLESGFVHLHYHVRR